MEHEEAPAGLLAPVGQGVQDELPAVLEKVPTSHGVQVVDASPEENVPAGQALQTLAPSEL